MQPMRNSLPFQAGGWATMRDTAWFGLPHGRYPVLALVTLALICGLTSAAGAQTRCTRDGDWLVCDDGERVPIAQDPNARPRMGVWRGWPGGSDGGRDPWMTDGARLPGPEGQVCWPHGDHVHCQ
jgi:hypothetical protein